MAPAGYFYLIGIIVGCSPFSLCWLFWHQEALWCALAASLYSLTLPAFGFFVPLHLSLAVRRHTGDVYVSVFACVRTCLSLRRTMTPKAVVSFPPWWLLLMPSQVSLICSSCWPQWDVFVVILIAVWDSECIEMTVLFQDLHHCVVLFMCSREQH